MTQYEKILRYMLVNPKTGVTIRDGLKLNINWLHKRIRELEEMGIEIRRVDENNEGVRFRRYFLMNPKQAADMVADFEKKRGV